MTRPVNFNDEPINWITTKIGQVNVKHPTIIGVSRVGLVIWDGQKSVQVFVPTLPAETVLSNAICSLAADLRTVVDRLVTGT